MTINIIVLVVLFIILVIFTTPWKSTYVPSKNDKKKVNPKSSEYFDQREIEAKKIQEDLKAKAKGVKKSEVHFEPVIRTKKN